MKAENSLLAQLGAGADTRAAFAGQMATAGVSGRSGAIGGDWLALRSRLHGLSHVFNIGGREIIFAARDKNTGTNRPRLAVGGGTGQRGIRGIRGTHPLKGGVPLSRYPVCTDPDTPAVMRKKQKQKTTS